VAYCRWSSANWRCDVYCYASVSGFWVTHVANNRVVGEIPNAGAWDDYIAGRIDAEQFVACHRVQMDWLATAPREPIGLPHDGESFDDPGPAEMRARLVELRALGYCIPDHVFDDLAEEASQPPEEQ